MKDSNKKPAFSVGDTIYHTSTPTPEDGFLKGFYRITGIEKSLTTKIDGYEGLVYSMNRITKDGNMLKSKDDSRRFCSYVDRLVKEGKIISITLDSDKI